MSHPIQLAAPLRLTDPLTDAVVAHGLTVDRCEMARELAIDALFRLGAYEPDIVIESGDFIDDRIDDYVNRQRELPSRLIVDVTAYQDSEFDRQWTPDVFIFADFRIELLEYHRRPNDDGRRIAVYHVEAI